MKKALVIGASGGIGSAVISELQNRGYDVTGISRSEDGIDLTEEPTIEAALSGVQGDIDLVFIAVGALEPAGQPPEKAVREVTGPGMAAAFAVNALGPMLAVKHALPLIAKDRPAVIAVLSARVGSIGDNSIGGWHSYRASKSALNQFIHGAAIEMKRTHKQAVAVCLHPGTVATRFTEKYAGRHKTTPPEQAAADLVNVIEGLTTEDSGGFYDYAGRPIPW
ncbi:MAG: SDR family NAD(P)-dependent oxidoreductase [Pseudomonadota bacterium]